MARDIIRAFVDALEREGVPAALAERVADRVRSEWGGERAYVLKGSGQPRAEKKNGGRRCRLPGRPDDAADV